MPLMSRARSAASAFLTLASLAAWAPAVRAATADNGDIAGVVRDSTNAAPIAGATITITNAAGQLVASVIADPNGRFRVHNLAPSRYSVHARFIGFRPESRDITLEPDGATVAVNFALVAVPITLSAVSVTTQEPLAIDTRSGNQVFQEIDYHGAPVNTTSQILQQSIAGAARAPTGEVHIRGQHAEYTYWLDGVPVPSGISGSLNELFDPAIVNSIEFETGGWDAEYGNKNAAIINVRTKVPAGGFHITGTGYGGTYNAGGAGLSLSSNPGRWGWFLSGEGQQSDMRQEPVMFDTITKIPLNFSNHGTDAFGFGKLVFNQSEHDRFNLEGNYTTTHFQVPYDSTQGFLDDHQTDVNSFANLSWTHWFGTADTTGVQPHGAELFTSLGYRHGSLDYVSGSNDDPSFIFYPDTIPFNVNEARYFTTTGAQANFTYEQSERLLWKTGVLGSLTTGHESFATFDSAGNPGPSSHSPLNGSDLGVYAQVVYSPTEWFQLRTGARYDWHTAPFAGTQQQLSPRIRLNFFLDPTNTAFLYYGRQFIPTNIEDLRAITFVSAGGDTVSNLPTLPERDDFYSAGFIHRFNGGIVLKLSGYYKQSSPGIDDNTIPGTAIVTSVNLSAVRISGIESVVEIRPAGPVSGYVNFALAHAYGRGPITGGFFPTDPGAVPGGWFDLDHDQRISVVGNVVYSMRRFYVSATGIYGSGLANGADQTTPIGTGLTDFNSYLHVKPNSIVDAAAGYTFIFGSSVVRPQIFVNNVFDYHYLLKGQFFSGASVGRPRTVQLQVSVGY
jgi:hypothetical protein